ncbi:MAG: Flp pilus assembly complex ATPase component TadA [Candidatus Thermoplasmatota archaeon]|nr:Flp pilus assembly complex ATPase component TadA [Candidatus Thermoplasmatota archaeon]
MKIVPDTSVIVDGRVTSLIEDGEFAGAEIIIPEAVVAELEYQANEGFESGLSGLDEIVRLQGFHKKGDIDLRFTGERPTMEETRPVGEIDAIIRNVSEQEGATLCTSDRLQAHVAEAKGLKTHYMRPASVSAEQEIESLRFQKYFEEDVMSVHLREGCRPYVKRGVPGNFTFEPAGHRSLSERDMETMSRHIIEAAKREKNSFLEIERKGVTVVQLEAMRVVIARPRFSDRFEITATRPVVKLDLDDYGLDEETKSRLSNFRRGVLVSGPPGSGKSTFAQAVAEYLHEQGAVVKTMESPRDLQVNEEITQYGPLEDDMELTSDILLLVRPDFVVFDEVRKGEDFRIFADMRLAGMGLIGVTHANRAIDAIQRLIGRVELGMIPQVTDTIIHINGGQIEQILEVEFTVKLPAGMEEADLARPVIMVKDFNTQKALYEIYTYGEQVVVMAIQDREEKTTGSGKLAERQLRHIVGRWIDGVVDCEITSDNSANVYVEEENIPHIIGKGGKTIASIEDEAGIKLNVKPLKKSEIRPNVIKQKNNVVLDAGPGHAGKEVDIMGGDELLLAGTLSQEGTIKVRRRSTQGKAIMNAIASNRDITMRPR